MPAGPRRRVGRLALAASLIAAAVAALAASPPTASGPQAPVDAALVLAVDVSTSIDDAEFRLQREGYAAAFRDARLADAIHQGRAGRIAVTLMHWASASEQTQVLGWTEIADEADAAAFAGRIAEAPRTRFPGGSTSLSGAITGAARLIKAAGFASPRRVIDISADGSNNNGRPPELARAEALAQGITINGLVILEGELLLDRYFEAHVMGGPGAFVIAVGSVAEIRDALVRKLVREIAGPGPGRARFAAAGANPLAGRGPSD
jgi:hypothetical protein